MTIPQADAQGYEVQIRTVEVVGTPPKVAVVTLRRGTTEAPWVAVEQTLAGTDLTGLPAVLDDLVERIQEPIPEEPEPEPEPVAPRDVLAELDELRARIEALERRGTGQAAIA